MNKDIKSKKKNMKNPKKEISCALNFYKKEPTRLGISETIFLLVVTCIIGLISGVLGIAITVLLTFPINSLIYKATDVVVVTHLPLTAGIVLIIISVILTLIGGMIPAHIASKQDPVIALRSE